MSEVDYNLIYQSIYKVLKLYDEDFAKEFKSDNVNEEVINRAILLASGGEFEEKVLKDKPLGSILDELSKKNINNFDIKKVDENIIFTKEVSGNYREIFDNLIKKNFKHEDTTFSCDKLDTILSEYLSFIPAPTKSSTISLYEFLKSTIAFATILKDSEKILLLNGNFGGIQKFIFTDVKTDKASKTLRARSASISMILNLIALKIIDRFKLTPFNIIQNASGKFFIVARESDEEELNKFIKEIEKDFFEVSKGEFNVSISFNIFEEKAFNSNNFHETIKVFSDFNNEKKFQKFEDRLGSVLAELNKPCIICKKRESQKNNTKCGFCEHMEIIGTKLPQNNTYLVIKKGNEKLFGFLNLDYSMEIVHEYPDEDDDILTVWDISQEPKSNFAKRDIFAFVPTKNGKIKDFDEITSNNVKEPIKGLITLKADVDSLGKIFKNRALNSFAKYNTLSKLIDRFFSNYLAYLLDKEFNNIYTVFAGGDDLFLIGKWDEVLRLNDKIIKEFKRFSNFNLTLSSGLFMSKSNKPVRYLSTFAKRALNDSKDFEKLIILKFSSKYKQLTLKDYQYHFNEFCKKSISKNAVSIFDLTMESDRFIKIMDIAKELQDYDIEYNLPTTFWYKLIEFCDKAEFCLKHHKKENMRDEEFENFLWKSQFRYLTQRNLIEKNKKDKQDKLIKFIEKLYNYIDNYKKDLKLALFYLIYQRRENGKRN